ncbi:4'-phosphopantetheinyl transferase family protein [Streptomyces sp. NPDC048219]|uniref:4'-phosphopantetheinyl transferase family protein n=1 Tax=Streptomyces sp. NPDC048219 TaxID=3365517 RepID=UPI00371A30DB
MPGPQGPWEPVQDRVEQTGRAVVHTTWGQWLTPALLDPALRTLLGRDWPRYRQHPEAAGRLAFAVSRLVLKHTAAAALQVPADRLDLAYRLGGRPLLRGLDTDVHVSLAHTGELITVAVSRDGPVGVDAEPVDRPVPWPALREQMCTPQEAERLAALPESERAGRLLRLWTLKEAYTKALGQGLRRRFTAFGFTFDAEDGAALDGDEHGAWSFATHVVQDRFLVSEAHRHQPKPEPEPKQEGQRRRQAHAQGQGHAQGQPQGPQGQGPWSVSGGR